MAQTSSLQPQTVLTGGPSLRAIEFSRQEKTVIIASGYNIH